MSGLRVNNLRGVAGSAPTFPDGVVVTGIATATTFDGNLTGNVTGNVVGNVTGDVTGNITGTTGSFSGNVSVGGTLTYDDVTNVDSIGIVTARGGIKVGAGQSISAVSGIITYYGDGSQLQGVESGVSNFVASGTLSNGQTVIVQSDGKVKAVGIETGSTPVFGTKATFNTTGATEFVCGVFDPDSNKVIITYRVYVNGSSSNDAAFAVVGTVNSSDNSISFGTPVKYFNTFTETSAIAYDTTNDKVVISFHEYSSNFDQRVIVGTVNGTSITFGSSVQLEGTSNSNTRHVQIVFDSSNNKCVFCYRDPTSNNYYGTARVGTVSGNSISFGSAVSFNGSSHAQFMQATFDSSNNKVVIAFMDTGNNANGKAVVGTVSGTSISFGSAVQFAAGNGSANGPRPFGIAFDSTNNKVVIAYADYADGEKGKAIVGTVSGTSISFGSAAIFNNANTYSNVQGSGAIYDSNTEKVVIAYRDSGNSNKGTAIVGTVNGTSISFGSEIVFNSSATNYINAIYDSTNKRFVIPFRDDSNSYAGTAIVGSFDVTNVTATNYIGIAAEAIADGATGKVTIFGGTNSGQTGLTTSQTYYVQNDGSLGTSAGNPSVVAGTSISSTKIIVKG